MKLTEKCKLSLRKVKALKSIVTQSEYESTSSEAIDMIKQERYDNWLAVVNSLPTEEIVTEITEEFVN